MKKSKRKRAKKAVSAGKPKDTSKTAEYVGYLLELHKLQGVLLNRLDKEVQ
ncbi:MAG: hypothetical protein ACE5NM_12745 [Sedimentisphaerales bacterium]